MEHTDGDPDNIPEFPDNGGDARRGVPFGDDPLAFQTLSEGIGQPDTDAQHVERHSSPEERAEQQWQEWLHEESSRITGEMTRGVAGSIDYVQGLWAPAPRLINMSIPLSVEQFDDTAVTPNEGQDAYAVLYTRAMNAYAAYPEHIQRVLGDVHADGTFDWGHGLYVSYSDNRGTASMLLQRDMSIVLHIADGKEASSYRYTPCWQGDAAVMQKQRISMPYDMRGLRGTVPATEVTKTGDEILEANARFTQEMESLTNKPVTIVGQEEALYLNDLLFSARPIGDVHHKGSLHAIIEKRHLSSKAPDPLHAAWACRELERIAQEHSSGMHGVRPQQRVYPLGNFKGRHLSASTTAYATSAGDRPATMHADTAFVAPASLFTKRRGLGKLTAAAYVVRHQTDLSAVGNTLALNDRVTMTGADGSVPFDHKISYDNADITEIHAFQQLLYNRR